MATKSTESTHAATPQVPAGHKFGGFKVPYILSWRNPYETGVLLAEVLGLFVMFSSTLTLRWFLRAAFWIVGAASFVEWGSRTVSGQKQGLVTAYQPSRFLPLSDSVVNDVASYVSYVFRRVIFGIQHVLDARDPEKGFKLAGLFYVLYVFLGLLKLRTLLLTAIVLSFSLPPLYLQFKTEVDDVITKVQAHVHEHLKQLHAKAHAKAGPQIDYVKKLVGPRGGFPGTANASPVGETPTAAAKPTAYTSGSSTSGSGATSSARDSSAHNTGFSSGPSLDSTLGTPSGSHFGSPSASGPISGLEATADKTPFGSHESKSGAQTGSAKSGVHDDAFKNFDSVPTLAGNVPIDHEKLSHALAEDKAKYASSSK